MFERQTNALVVEERLWGGKLCLGFREVTPHGQISMCYGSMEKEWENLGRVAVRDTGATSASGVGVDVGGGCATPVSKPTGWRHIGTFFFIHRSIILVGLTPCHCELTLY